MLGTPGTKIYNTFKFETGQELNYEQIVAHFNAHFCPKKNIDFERYKFMNCSQEGLPVMDYVTKLRKMAADCEFDTLEDSLVKTRLICGIKSDKLRKRLLQENALTLDKAIEMCISHEEVQKQITVMSTTDNVFNSPLDVNVIEQRSKPTISGISSRSRDRYQGYDKCNRCNLSHRRNNCPAWNKACSFCHELNHFERCCPKKVQQRRQVIHEVEAFNLDQVSGNACDKNEWIIPLSVPCIDGNNVMNMKIDTGAMKNIFHTLIT